MNCRNYAFMLKLIPFLLICNSFVPSFAQSIELLNNVVYENKKPIAYFSKLLYKNNPDNVTGLYVYNSQKKLIASVVPKLVSVPLSDIKPFYYHHISFLRTNDSLLIYPEEALSLHIFKIIKDYRLIHDGEIDSSSLSRLLTSYDRSSFVQKMSPVWQHLYNLKQFGNQVKRDRSKPVYLVNEAVIMQDSIKVGYFAKKFHEQAYSEVNSAHAPNEALIDSRAQAPSMDRWEYIEVRMADDTPIDSLQVFLNLKPASKLFQSSLALQKNPTSKYIERLAIACLLIENFVL